MSECPYCHTTFEEIMQTGFVGCRHCYDELPELKEKISKLYQGKAYKGRTPREAKHGSV